jgi:hypothetical protein
MTIWARMVEEDKAQHIICAYMAMIGMQFFMPTGQAVLLVLFLGLLKEFWDLWIGTGICWYDVLANTLGATFALLLLCIGL